MTFSIIIPIYNCKLLSEMLYCFDIQNYLKDDFEIIIVDDGSEEKYRYFYKVTIEKYTEFDIKYTYIGDKQGRFRANLARNMGAKQAEYENLIFLDSDSLVPEYYLKHFSSQLLIQPNIHITIGESVGYTFPNTEYIDPTDIIEKNYQKYLSDPQYEDFRKRGAFPNFWYVFLGGNFCIRKSDFNELGGWDEKIISWGEDDIDFAFRAYKKDFRFGFFEGIEIYNIADGPRLTSEKLYSVLLNQCTLYNKYNQDREYHEYVRHRYDFTPQKFKTLGVPEKFSENFM